MYEVKGFHFSDKYKSWNGTIKVKSSKKLSQKEINLCGFMESEKTTLSKEEYKTIVYIQTNFDVIYENILQAVLELNMKGIIFETCNLTDSTYNSFSPIVFSNINEIPRYLGEPSFELLPGYKKDQRVFFTINFQKECFLSIEHGLNFLFFEDELIHWEASSDSVYITEKLKSYEKNCTKWKKGFWSVFYECFEPYEDNKDMIREKWLNKR